MRGEGEQAVILAQEAIDIGNRVSNADLRAYAQTNLGRLKIVNGECKMPDPRGI